MVIQRICFKHFDQLGETSHRQSFAFQGSKLSRTSGEEPKKAVLGQHRVTRSPGSSGLFTGLISLSYGISPTPDQHTHKWGPEIRVKFQRTHLEIYNQEN